MRSDIRCVLLQALACALLSAAVAGAESKSLQIFFVDVEGGQATLLVSPSGQSMLVDTGWPGFNGRDADRIVSAARSAGLHQIDYVVITHYHVDHVGGVAQLADRIKIGTFVDHGPNLEEAEQTKTGYATYREALAKTNAKHLVLKPGDRIPISGLDVQVITAARQHINKPLPGAGQLNSFCQSEPAPP